MPHPTDSAAPDRPDFFEAGKLNRQTPLRDQVYALVRKAIVVGDLPPGSPVNEIEIAARLGVSRTPVREAVKKVSDEGLIEVFAQHGTFVADIRRAQVEEAYVIRIALELESVERAASAITPARLLDLEDVLMAHEVAVRRERYHDAIARDDDFHRMIAEVNDLHMLWRAVDISKAQMDRCRLRTLPDPGKGQETLAQHRRVLEALQAGDPVAARTAMRDHLTTSQATTLHYLDRLEAEG